MTTTHVDTDRLATMLKALSNPSRLEMFRRMSEAGDASCTVLTRDVALAQSTVSEHLKVLKDAGLIELCCADNPKSGYCVRRDALIWFKQAIVAI